MNTLASPPAGILFTTWPGRLAPADTQMPGILAPLLGRSLLQRALERLVEHGLHRIHVVVGDNAGSVRALLGTGARWGCQLTYHYLPPAARRCSLASFLSGLGVAGGRHFWLADATLVPTAALGNAAPAATGIQLCWRAPGQLRWSGWGCFSGDWLLAQTVRFERDAIARRVLDEQLLHASVIPAPLSAVDPAALLRTGRHLLGGDATTQIGRACRIHPSARILAPSWIGPNVHIGAGAVVGPHAMIESGAFIDCGTRIANAMVLPDTYVGADLDVRAAIIAGPCLHSIRHAACTTVSEPWLLADLASSRPRMAALERPLAGLLRIVLAPLAPLARQRASAWSTHFVQVFLPGLEQVRRGRLRLAGPPRANAQAAAGLLHEALVLAPEERDDATRYASALLAAARQNDMPYALGLLARYLKQLLPLLLARPSPPTTCPENRNEPRT